MKIVAEKSGWVVENYIDNVLIGYEINDDDGPWSLTSDPFDARIYPSEELARDSDIFVNATIQEKFKIRFMRKTVEVEQ